MGILGITGLTYIFTWQDLWHEVHRDYGCWSPATGWEPWYDSIIAVALLVSWAIIAVKSFNRHSLPSIALASFTPLAVIALSISILSDQDLISTLLFNLYMLALGLAYLVQGCRTIRLRLVNFGMLILSLLLITRFFDSEFGFLTRGIAFILIGCGFLAANLLIARQKRKMEGLQA